MSDTNQNGNRIEITVAGAPDFISQQLERLQRRATNKLKLPTKLEQKPPRSAYDKSIVIGFGSATTKPTPALPYIYH